MLAPPLQSADILHRSEIVADLRNAEIQKNLSQEAQAIRDQLEKDEHRDTEVEEAVRVEIDPHEMGEKQPGYLGNKKRRQKKPTAQPNSETAAPKRRNLGAGHIDITV